MTNQQFPSLNGFEPSWADVGCTAMIGGGALVEMDDFASIKWGDKLEVGEKRGPSGGRVIRQTVGSLSSDASAAFFRAGLRRLVRALMAIAPQRGNQRLISLVRFNILVQHTPPGETDIFKVEIRGCRLSSRAWDVKEGNDADKVDVDLKPLAVVELIDDLEAVLL